MSEQTSYFRNWRRNETAVLFFLLFFLPILLFWEGGAHLLALRRQAAADRWFAASGRALDQLKPLARPEDFFHRLLSGVHDRADRAADPQRALGQEFRALRRRYPGVFRFVAWDGRGEPIDALTEETGLRFILRKVYQGLRVVTTLVAENPRIENLRRRPEVTPFMSSFASYFGNAFVPDQLLFPFRRTPPPSIILVSSVPARSFVWYKIGKSISFLCFLHRDAVEDHPGLRFALFHRRPRRSPTRFGFWALDGKSSPLVQGTSATDARMWPPREDGAVLGAITPHMDEIREKMLGAETTSEDQVETDHFLMKWKAPNNSLRLFALIPKERALPDPGLDSFLLLLGLAGLAIPGILFTLPLFFPAPHRFLSMRTKLVGLFLFGSGIPLLVLVFLGSDYLVKKQESVYRTERTHLYAVRDLWERRRESFYLSLENRLRRAFRPLLPPSGGPVPPGLGEKVFPSLQGFALSQAVFCSTRSGILGQMFPKARSATFLSQEILKRITALTLKGLSSVSPAALRTRSLVSGADVLEEAIRKSLVERRERINALPMDLNSIEFIAFPFDEGPDGVPRHAFILFWERAALLEYFIRESIGPDPAKASQIRKVAYRFSDGKTFTAEPELAPDVRAFLREGSAHRGIISRLVDDPGGPLLGISAPFEIQYALAVFLPLQVIDDEIRSVRVRLFVFAAVMFLLMGALGWVLSDQFLAPSRAFGEAAGAIRDRRFEFRVPPLGSDELGHLGQALNQAMEGLRELELARFVQEGLFPPPELRMGEFEVFGRTVPMREVGGDLFDFLPLADGRSFAIFVGDVAGHGVAAALVMMTVKTGLEINREGFARPADLLLRLNSLVHRLTAMGRKRMVSGLLLVIDSQTGMVTFSSAGHPYPVHLRQPRGAEFVKLVAVPLGTKKKGQYGELRFEIGPGETVFLYSDGLIESRNARSEEFGYEAFCRIAEEHRLESPRGQYDRMFQAYLNHRSGSEVQDDITLVIVKRCGRLPA